MEYLDIINEDDQVLGKDTKENKFVKGFLSRNVAIFLKNKDGKYILVKRAAHKKVDPNKLDVSVCGHVMSGEGYEQAALREMQEEIGGICEVTLLKKKITTLHVNGQELPFMTCLFVGEYNKPIILNDESSGYQLFSLEELKESMNTKPELFTQGLKDDLKHIKELLN